VTFIQNQSALLSFENTSSQQNHQLLSDSQQDSPESQFAKIRRQVIQGGASGIQSGEKTLHESLGKINFGLHLHNKDTNELEEPSLVSS